MRAIDVMQNPGYSRLAVPIGTARLELRPFEAADIPTMVTLLSDPEATRWIGGVKSEHEAACSVIRMRDIFNTRGWGTLAVHLPEAEQCVGYCGVRPLPHTGDLEIAFGFLKPYWNQGYATEASAACIDATFGNLGVDSIVATVYPGNDRSLAVLRKLNMRQERTVFGQWPESVALLFRVTRDEWLARGAT